MIIPLSLLSPSLLSPLLLSPLQYHHHPHYYHPHYYHSHCNHYHTHRDLGESDFDIMMQRRKEAMARARRRRKKVNYLHVRYIIIILHYFHQDGDSAASIDLIVEMIHQMKQAAEVCVCYMGAFCSVEVCAVTG